MKPRLIPLSVPLIAGNAWRYVKDCLDTGWVSSAGAYVGRFETAARRLTGSAHAVAGVNGTACLHAGLRAAGVGPGDSVVVPALTFIATANAVTYCGARPVFVDCEPARFNIDLDRLEDFLENRCRRRRGVLRDPEGGRVRAVVPVHTLGFPVDMPRLMAIARRHRLFVLEDAAESIGSLWEGRHTGTFAPAGVLSFNGNKVVTCGGGGLLLTGSASFARRVRHLTEQAKSAPDEYIHDEVGHNYRLTNVLAALGVSQLELLPSFLKRREAAAAAYRRRLPGVFVEPLPPQASWNRWLFAAQASTAAAKKALLARLNAGGCQSRSLWAPVPLQKPYRNHWSTPIPNARRAYATVVNFPSATSLTEADVARVARILRGAPLARLLL